MIFPQILFLFLSWQLILLTSSHNINWISCDVIGNLNSLKIFTMSSKPSEASKSRASRGNNQPPSRDIAKKLDSFVPAPSKHKEERTILPSSSVSLPPANLSDDLSFQLVSNKRKRSGHPPVRESISPDRSKRTNRKDSPPSTILSDLMLLARLPFTQAKNAPPSRQFAKILSLSRTRF